MNVMIKSNFSASRKPPIFFQNYKNYWAQSDARLGTFFALPSKLRVGSDSRAPRSFKNQNRKKTTTNNYFSTAAAGSIGEELELSSRLWLKRRTLYLYREILRLSAHAAFPGKPAEAREAFVESVRAEFRHNKELSAPAEAATDGAFPLSMIEQVLRLHEQATSRISFLKTITPKIYHRRRYEMDSGPLGDPSGLEFGRRFAIENGQVRDVFPTNKRYF